MRKFTELSGRVVRLAFSPEGTTLTAAVRGSPQLGIWEWPGGQFRHSHLDIDGAVSTFAYSPDGKWLVVGGDIGLALPYLRARNIYESEITLKQRPVDGLAFSSRVVPRRTVVAVGADRVRLYNLDGPNTRQMLWGAQLPSGAGWFRSVAFHPSADVLVGCDTTNKLIRVWNPLKRDQSVLVTRKSAPTAAVFSNTGERLLVASGGQAQLLETEAWETVAECKHARGKVTDVAASPCGRWFATAGTDGIVRLWESSAGAAVRAFDWQFGPVTAIAFSPDGLTCAAGAENGKVVVWDVDV